MSLSRFASLHRSSLVEHLSGAIACITFLLACLAAVALISIGVRAQTVDDAHLQPRRAPATAKQPPASPAEPSAAADLVKAKAPAFVKNVELVLVPVMITDAMNQLVTTFRKENFRVYEGDQEQAIHYFSSEDAPLSLGVIADVSLSMTSKIDKAREAAIDFFRIANPQDEFCLVTFSDRPHPLVDFGEPIEDIERKLDYVTPKGRTALLDAIYMGMTKMRHARHFRKALLIISDGGDNTSRFSAGEIKDLVMESDVQIYAISISASFFKTVEEVRGKRLLRKLAEATGGRAFTANKASELPAIAAQIGRELRSQYLLGYPVPKSMRNGKWRKIKVSLVPPQESPRLRVYAKTGYYGPKE